ncbi:unnamed protein product [Nezara viridula]|uniref:Uncharacterized protein n=1 Tax=Nezara viridula TaxID=85310 RepID=A0A9P0MTU3_NEZVI|nr:unnamed protein product [Nezara viridula]
MAFPEEELVRQKKQVLLSGYPYAYSSSWAQPITGWSAGWGGYFLFALVVACTLAFPAEEAKEAKEEAKIPLILSPWGVHIASPLIAPWHSSGGLVLV